MKISFITLGCKVNQYETELLKNMFLNLNFEIVDFLDKPDIYIINSCTVTSNSDFKIRSWVSKCEKINPQSIKVLVGCFAQAFPNKFDFFKCFDVVIGNVNKFELPQILKQFLINRKPIVLIKNNLKNSKFSNLTISKFQHHSRAFVKIEDGCNRACTYCVITKARGFVKSKPLKILKQEVEQLANNFYNEIVLVGISVSSYGIDFNCNINWVDAIEVVNKVEQIKRIRIGSLDPDLITETDLLKLSRIKKFCPNFHLSLQSGSNSVLKRMGRKYNTDNYMNLVGLIFKIFKNPSITTDLMVGFPQETEFEFEESLNIVEQIGFLKVHIFPYSRRANTVAAKMMGQLTKAEKKIRVAKMKQVANVARLKFLNKQINEILEVLFEKQEQTGVFVGYSKNYILVKVKSDENLCGLIRQVKIEKININYCYGKLVDV